ncbi:ectoine hydroxylase-related dioxygenase (phytanoyl-CoA dioxygenase family) [Kribbella orskensis]|uniref:Ectoine hydroxylase-related dioxygenase (Phytanoyl-CoA dioxygenase family) n=1 Tax=Kribbella orskensis TaxID=2512216 RepID=A0ABY2BQ99_9ACTN|nr:MULTISPECIES: phytanoyl-CoA dioxygenase family protein [Kribbella]TCN37291.1 ectoine hydroxylase-related dioxygenase (phytanoyl-CoA dioxygenase family) [Kribbella sp. VKM Ac-2500]TCO27801.1 ectoine hydroxylase-related dioxygenase (phytanoyl-CoA dioxygenase family) [Kribbella orskensis]
MTVTRTDLESNYSLDRYAIARFAEHGFVKLKNVLSPETITQYEPEITGKVIELNTQDLPLEERDTYGKAFLQVMNLWQDSERVLEFVSSPRLARVAAQLLGVRSVRLYHDQALYKESGGGVTPWHADQYYWPFATDRCVTVWIPLQETPLEMGPLAFASGSHTFEHGRDLPISDESERVLQEALAEQSFPEVVEPYELGEVSYHLGWTFHHAAPNGTDVPRRVMTIIYVDAAMEIAPPANNFQEADLAAWLPGNAAGETISSPLNPVLYSG